MTRFEIQDIIRQNQDGVTFRALDKKNDQIVSLRRFFPFGQCDENEEGGDGLDPAEGKAFSTACERLSKVKHPALRRTIYGDIDPIDGMPYLVTEWIEGESLSDVLGNNAMPADMTIALVQQVFDVCKLLSETLQSEAIWIDTNPQSIIVCNPNEKPTFSFRICPFKWLGTSNSHLKDMSSIVSLIEALMGWKTKLVSDQAGKGLGGYIKLLRQYPEMDINKASQSLPNHSYEVVEVVSETNTKTPTTLFPPIPSSNASFLNKKSITFMSISALVTGSLIFFFYQQQTKQSIPNSIVESKVYDPSDNPEMKSNSEIITPVPEPPITAPDKTETDSEKNKTATNINVPPVVSHDKKNTTSSDKEKDPKLTETTAKTIPEQNLQTNKTLASTTWSPISIPAVVWYDASTASIKDGMVTIANSGSGGGFISGPASLVDNGIGNLQAVQFNPNNTYLTGEYINTDTTLTAFFVGKSLNVSQTAYAGMMSIWQDGRPNDYDNIGNTVLFNQNNAFSNTVQTYRLGKELSTTTGNLTAGFVAGTVFNGTTNTSYLNGNSATSVNNVGNFNSNKIVIGARWHGSSHKHSWNGNFGEAIIFNTELSESDRQKIEGYLAHKWNLTGDLPVNHPFKTLASIPSTLTATDVGAIKTLKVGDSVTLQGIVKSAKFSSTGKSMYLSFSEPDVETDIRVVIHGNEYIGTAFTEAEFSNLIGKNLIFDGTVYTESFNDRPPFVKITEKSQIKLATKTPDKPITPDKPNDLEKPTETAKTNISEKADGKSILSPDDAASLDKMNPNDPIAVKGIVQSVKVIGNRMDFSFSSPPNTKQIQVITFLKFFNLGSKDVEKRKKAEEDYQYLVGKMVTFNGAVYRNPKTKNPLIFIAKPEDMVVEEPTDQGTSEVGNNNDNPEKSKPHK
jgi:hypothetical protein